MEEEKEGYVLHLVVFPWLAMGHLIPFYRLSKLLTLRGHRVSFVSTPRNLQKLPQIPENLEHLLRLVSLPMPKVENLPENAESSTDLPHHKAEFLKIAYDMLRLPLSCFLENAKPKPDWIIYDYACHWLPPMAAQLGISRAYFSLFNAAFLAFLGPITILLSKEPVRRKIEDFTCPPKWVPFPSEVVYRHHEAKKYFQHANGNKSGTTQTQRLGACADGCDIVLIRNCVEFEPDWFNLVCELYKKPFISVGVLPPLLEEDDGSLDNAEKWANIKEWLDGQRENSVVYVALGSESPLKQKELCELALGLELSGLPFFWAIRKPPGLTEDVSETLPDGFEERVKDRGAAHMGWVPQIKILSHPAVGGFLTHCGANSVIEGLTFGRVLILFPWMSDQPLNARTLQRKELGVEIPRNEKDGSFTRDSVAYSVRFAMVSEEGASLRANAIKMRSLFGSSDRNGRCMDNVIRCFVELKTSQRMA